MWHARILFVCFLAWTAVARADLAHEYGRRGRTIVAGELWLYRANLDELDRFDHELSRSAGLSTTLLQFLVDNVALGGTLLASGSALDNDDLDRPRTLALGADVDLVGYVPLRGRYGLRLWGWAGIRWQRFRYEQDGEGIGLDGQPLGTDTEYTTRSMVFGLSPRFLLHLSPSVALTLGPTFSFTKPLSEGELVRRWDFGPELTYSFGPDSDGMRLENASRFAAQGRSAVSTGGGLSNLDQYLGLAYTRFVRPGIGLGGYAAGGRADRAYGDMRFLSLGFQAMFDVTPLQNVSLLFVPRLGYGFKRPSVSGGVGSSLAHELQLSLGAYLAVHLHDGLLIGVGPEVRSDVRLAGGDIPGAAEGDMPNAQYVRGGLGSVIAASF